MPSSGECVQCGGRWTSGQRTGRPRRYCSRSCQARAYRGRRDGGPAGASGRAPVDPGSSLLGVAAAIADEQGIAAVSLRSVAAEAGTTLTKVQRELGSRDRLVASMVQQVLARRQPARHRAGPVETLGRLAEEEWSTYRSHPWLVEVLASTRPPLVPAVLDAARAAVEAFVVIGFDPGTAFRRYLALSGYVQGMAVLLGSEPQAARRSGTTYPSWWRAELGRLERTGTRPQHRWLDGLGAGASAEVDVDRAFRDGLDRVLDGLVRRAEGPTPTAGVRTGDPVGPVG